MVTEGTLPGILYNEDMNNIRIKRVYEPASLDDGYRVLVDRIWPRGLTKEKVHADLWLKEIAPSNELRAWFHHDPTLREEFKKRYFAELELQPQIVTRLLDLAMQGPVTLLFSASDTELNNAVVLADYLTSKLK